MTEKSKRQKYINHSIYVDTFVPILVQLNYYSEILDYTPPPKKVMNLLSFT